MGQCCAWLSASEPCYRCGKPIRKSRCAHVKPDSAMCRECWIMLVRPPPQICPYGELYDP